jgi:hypothetical protein
MLKNQVFYHGILRKTIVAFGSLFSNIKIERKRKSNDAGEGGGNIGDVVQTLDVPIAYAPKEKWIVRVDSDPTLENQVYTTLPRLSFEITSMTYDSSRKVSRMNKLVCVNGDTRNQIFAPVPYNVEISLYAIAKTQEDCLQIIEQILPYFTPEYTLSVRMVDDMEIVTDVPIILNSVAIQDDYDGDFQTRRFVIYTLTFTLKVMLFGPESKANLINTVNVGTPLSEYSATQTTINGAIIEGWNDT